MVAILSWPQCVNESFSHFPRWSNTTSVSLLCNITLHFWIHFAQQRTCQQDQINGSVYDSSISSVLALEKLTFGIKQSNCTGEESQITLTPLDEIYKNFRSKQ